MSKVDVKWVLSHIHRLVEDPETTAKDAIAALRMAGDYLKMFEHEKKVSVTARNIVARLPMEQLMQIAGPTVDMKELSAGSYTMEEPWAKES